MLEERKKTVLPLIFVFLEKPSYWFTGYNTEAIPRWFPYLPSHGWTD